MEPTKPPGLGIKGRVYRAKVEVDGVPGADRVEEPHRIVVELHLDAFERIPGDANLTREFGDELVQGSGPFRNRPVVLLPQFIAGPGFDDIGEH